MRTSLVVLAAVAIASAWVPAQAQTHRFAVYPAADGAADAVRLDTHTGGVAVLGEGGDGALTWTRLSVPPGARVPSSYQNPSYTLSALPLRADETFLVDGQGGRTFLLRRRADGLVWEELE